MICTWARWCGEPARHHVERETHPGMTVAEDVCDKHLQQAKEWGYRQSGPADEQGHADA